MAGDRRGSRAGDGQETLDLRVSKARLLIPAVLPMPSLWLSTLNPTIRSTTTLSIATALTVAYAALLATALIQKWGILATPAGVTIRAPWPWHRTLTWSQVADIEVVRRLAVSQLRITTDSGKRVWLPTPVGYGWTHPGFDVSLETLLAWWQAQVGVLPGGQTLQRQPLAEGVGYPWPGQPAPRSPWAPPPGS